MDVFYYHPSLCQLALPMRASKGPWTRDVGTASVAIDMTESGLSLPSGKFLRLLLLAILDAAARSRDTRVDMGATSPDFVGRLGLSFNPAQLRGLSEQVDRLLAARMTVSLDGGLGFSVLDGRSRPALDAAGWRSALKLNAKFLTHFMEKSIPLDRAAVMALWDVPTALDTFAAIAFVTAELPADEVAMTGWDDLLARFGTKGQDIAGFRIQFEADLDAVRPYAPNLSLVVGDEGVEIRNMAVTSAEMQSTVSAAVQPERELTLEEELMALQEPETSDILANLSDPDFEILNLDALDAVLPNLVEAPVVVENPTSPPRWERNPQTPRVAIMQEEEAVSQGGRRAGRVLALKSHLTGLQQVVWLQRAQGRDDPLVEVTPGGRYDPATVTVLALEPVVVQIAGGLYQRDFDRVSSWAMVNRDLIDAFWFDEIDDVDLINDRVKKVPAPGWRE